VRPDFHRSSLRQKENREKAEKGPIRTGENWGKENTESLAHLSPEMHCLRVGRTQRRELYFEKLGPEKTGCTTLQFDAFALDTRGKEIKEPCGFKKL